MVEQSRQLWEAELFRLLVENVKDYAIFIVGVDGKVLSWSKGGERLCGWKEEEIKGQSADILFTPEDRQSGVPEKELREALETNRGEDDRWQIRKDGSRFWCSGMVTPLRDENGQLRGFAKIMRDLTEKKLAQEKLQETEAALRIANLQKDRFLAVLSHELRNPLAPIRNTLQIISQLTKDSPQLQLACEMMDRNVRVLTRLIDDLLDLSRIASGKVQIDRELVEVGVIMERGVEMARSTIEVRNHSLIVTLPKEALWIQGDPIRLRQVMMNLLTNAAKYTDEGGKIWFSAEREGDSALIRVRDTGIGIEPDKLPHLFDMFTQVEASSNRTQGGLGIGLSVVRKLVELHGGTVDARSGGRGTGSEFIVRLPVVTTGSIEQGPSLGPAKPTERSLRVLVVDDNADSADSMAMLLKLSGHEAQAVYSGAEALHLAKTHQPQVIFLDLSMPLMDGYQVAQRLQLSLDMSKIVLIAMTGYGHEADRQRSREAGFTYFLVKPADPQQLQELLMVLADERRG